jgi:hypothetical protein
MRRRRPLRESRLVNVAVGASMLAVPASAAAVADSQHSSSARFAAKIRARRVQYGRDVVVTGRAPGSDAGQTLVLEYVPSGSSDWRQVATATVGRSGRFRLTAPLARSGLVRLAGSSSSSTPNVPLALAASSASPSASSAERVAVAAAIRVRPRAIHVLGGSRMIHVRGRLLPAAPHRRVALQALRAGRWVTLAVARTGPRGGFDLHYRAGRLGRRRLRVRFAGDAANAWANHGAGTLTVYRQAAASWYDDGGNTACGFHAYYGVANLSLPCGARVSFVSGGRSVTAVVDDRGPYVGGRTWDLNQNTAAALGVGGVETVWSSF